MVASREYSIYIWDCFWCNMSYRYLLVLVDLYFYSNLFFPFLKVFVDLHFSSDWMLSHCLLDGIVSDVKSAVNFDHALKWMNNLFVTVLSILSLCLAFSSLTMLYLVTYFFEFILLGVCWGSYMCKLLFFIKFIKFLDIISQILFLLCLLFFSSLLPFSILLLVLLVLGVFFRLEQKDFSLCLLFSSASLSLLLNLSNEFFIPLPYFLIPEFYILFFFIFLSLLLFSIPVTLFCTYILLFFACIYSSLFTLCPGFI